MRACVRACVCVCVCERVSVNSLPYTHIMYEYLLCFVFRGAATFETTV